MVWFGWFRWFVVGVWGGAVVVAAAAVGCVGAWW